VRTIALLSHKGGAGKSTLATHLAVTLGAPVLDLDPQGSSAKWAQRREAESPVVMSGVSVAAVKKAAEEDGDAFLILDTPPHSGPISRDAAHAADLVLIPARPSVFDLDAIEETIELLDGTPAAIVVNAGPAPRKGKEASIVAEAREALSGYEVPVCPVAVSDRVAFRYALIDGLAVTEFETKGRAADEIRALARWIRKELK
jgi:chromosome partitioning protein